MSLARDGAGGLVYLGQAGGVPHVFVSREAGGVFGAPQRVDIGLSGPSSEPVIASGPGGVLLVAFINGGSLYASEAPSATGSWQAPIRLHSGAQSPSLQMNRFNKAYVAFTADAGTGSDVRVDYFASGHWAPVTAPLNVTPGDDAGTGTGRPVVATSGDGIGVVAWGEAGHLYSRRVWGTSPSVVDQQLDPASFAGASEVAVSDPAIGTGGNSSYVDVAYQETLSSGGQVQNRVLMTPLISTEIATPVAVDGLPTGGSAGSPAGGSAGSPAVAMGEYGRGFITAINQTSDRILSTSLDSNGVPGTPSQVDSGPGVEPPRAVPAVAGPNSALIAWQASPLPGESEVLARVSESLPILGAPIVLAPAGGGATAPGDELTVAGDNSTEAAIAWVQGSPGSLSIDLVQLYQPPGAPLVSSVPSYVRSAEPVLSWGPAPVRWGPITYTVLLDGTPIAHTRGTSYAVSSQLTDGPHSWSVVASNPAGQDATSRLGRVFVDTAPPTLSIRLGGRRRAHRRLILHIDATDPPAPEPGAQASGLSRVAISWGRGLARTREAGSIRRAAHVYGHPGRYRIRVTATDRAGNAISVSRLVRVRK